LPERQRWAFLCPYRADIWAARGGTPTLSAVSRLRLSIENLFELLDQSNESQGLTARGIVGSRGRP